MSANFYQGLSANGFNGGWRFYNSPNDITPSGTFVGGVITAENAYIAINYQGTENHSVVIPSGLSSITREFKVIDTFGKAGTAFILVSGVAAGVTINGLQSGLAITTNYGSKTFYAIPSGTDQWVAV